MSPNNLAYALLFLTNTLIERMISSANNNSVPSAKEIVGLSKSNRNFAGFFTIIHPAVNGDIAMVRKHTLNCGDTPWWWCPDPGPFFLCATVGPARLEDVLLYTRNAPAQRYNTSNTYAVVPTISASSAAVSEEDGKKFALTNWFKMNAVSACSSSVCAKPPPLAKNGLR